MKHSNALSKTLITALAVVALGVLAVSATGCSTSVIPYTPAKTPAPVTPAASSTAAPAAGAASSAAADPTVAQGKAIVQSSCIGRCHGANLLDFRTSQASAVQLASSMGSRAGLSADKQQAVATFFAQ